jgi:hypothetical protein
MKTKIKVIVLLMYCAFQSACYLPQKLRKAQWTVAEVKEWSMKTKNSTWRGLLLYQGSDSVNHYFISRVMDEFVWFEIKIAEIKIDETIPKKNKHPGYYYVDPLKDFTKVKDY